MENPDPTINYEEIESKKWSFARLNDYHNFALSSFQNIIDAGENKKNESLVITKNRKTRTFSVIGVVLTILLGYSSIYQLELNIFFGALSLITATSIIMYAYYHWVFNTITKEFQIILDILNKSINHIIASHEESITSFYDLENILQKDIDTYFEFLRLLLHCLTLEYEEKTSSKLNPNIHPNLHSGIIEKERVELLHETFEKLEKTNLPQREIKFIDEILTKPREYEK